MRACPTDRRNLDKEEDMSTKIKLKIQEMSYQHSVKTRTDVLTELQGVKQATVDLCNNGTVMNLDTSRITTKNITKSGFKAIEKFENISLQFLSAVLILFLGVIGCSDVPYSGPILSVDHVDRYLDSVGEDTICLQDGFDSICLKEIPGEYEAGDNVPIVNVHPTSLVFMFYYEDRLLLRAERLMDTSQIVQEMIDSGQVQSPIINGTNGNVPEEWVIQIYYPDSFPEAKRGKTPNTSGFDIKVAKGMKQNINNQQELKIKNFTQINVTDGTRGIQFSIETEAKDITIQVDKLVSGYTAKFYINADGVASDEGTNILQLIPLQ